MKPVYTTLTKKYTLNIYINSGKTKDYHFQKVQKVQKKQKVKKVKKDQKTKRSKDQKDQETKIDRKTRESRKIQADWKVQKHDSTFNTPKTKFIAFVGKFQVE